MADYTLCLVSNTELSTQLETIRAELGARGYEITEQQHLNPGFDSAFNSGRPDPMGDAVRLNFSGLCDTSSRKALCEHLSTCFELDAFIQTAEDADTVKKLACFDMDSTLIQHEVMDELAYRYGIGEKISAVTESAMRGEISFKQSFEQRLACLEGFDAGLIPGIAQSLKLTPGAKTLIKTLKAHGMKVAILSGGFENFAVHLQNQLGSLDYIHANILEIESGKLTGRISNELVNETRKLALIQQLAKENDLTATQTIAVGDGANDIPMLLYAGLGMAYDAKPVVQEKALHCINHTSLASILYMLGYSRAEFVTAG